ncbi:endonuclease domain-containing protein [Bacteroidota bacterium]
MSSKFKHIDMSLTKNTKLRDIAKLLCRELRHNQTNAESILWEYLRNRKFHDLKFYRQHPLFYDLLGRETFYIADFYCHTLKLVIEVDGPIHKSRYHEDAQRTEVINFLKIDVLRFRNEEIENDLDKVLERLKEIIDL